MLFLSKLKELMNWAISNFWNLFSFLGVIATIYVGFFYVPDYVEDIAVGKQRAIHQELVSDIQELIFYDQPIDLEYVQSVITGKELAYSIDYKYSSTDLLNQIQNEFIKNKFIPLEKRNELILKIKDLRVEYIEPDNPIKQTSDITNYLQFAISLITIIISLLAIMSIYIKHKNDKETEVDISSSSDGSTNYVMNKNSQHIHAAYEYENMVGEVLDELSILSKSNKFADENRLDFIADINGKEFIVEVKAFRNKLGLGTARDFAYLTNSFGKGGILVAKSGVTTRTNQLINEHNKLSENQPIYIISGESKQEIKEALQGIVK